MKTKKKWVIKFRSGSYFQSLAADRGGPLKTAQTFGSKEEVEELMEENPWIYLNGGMARFVSIP